MSLSVSEYTGSGVTIFLNSSILRITKPGKRSLMPSARVLLPLPGKPVIQMTRPLMAKAYHRVRLNSFSWVAALLFPGSHDRAGQRGLLLAFPCLFLHRILRSSRNFLHRAFSVPTRFF